jgi:high-affinity nickel-transport protein
VAPVPVEHPPRRRRLPGRLAGSLAPPERRRLSLVALVILGLHVAGFGMLVLLVTPRYPALGSGVGLTAWTLGLRHAFDPDHISAIDNTTRKLRADGRRPVGVGFSFALGHSSVVLVLAVGLGVAARQVAAHLDDGDGLRNTGGLIGTLVSASFLLLIALLNLVILLGILGVFRQMREGRYDERQLEDQLQRRGLMNRVLGPLARSVRSSWQMFPIGFIFGLGFDTASEVALFAIAAGAATNGLPLYAIMAFPIIFAAGMTLMDTADGVVMTQAYGWAFSSPVRKVYYNITITGLSVAVAFLIGGLELLGVLAIKLDLDGGVWRLVRTVDGSSVFGVLGYGIAGLFLLTWAGAVAYWHLARVEERWALDAGSPPPAPG